MESRPLIQIRLKGNKKMTDNINPSHYRQHAHECIEFTQHLNFNLGNAFKYIWRHKEKGGCEDLEKAIWYLKRQRDYAPKFKKIKYRRYIKIIDDLNDCRFDNETRVALAGVLFIGLYGNDRDREGYFAGAITCVKTLLNKMPSENTPNPERK